jgi:Kef-type K+ transport system membrane component KefB/nucleotide-binding universal stress UspA family protein
VRTAHRRKPTFPVLAVAPPHPMLAPLLGNPLTRLFAQVIVIVTVSRVLGLAMRTIRQPMVIAEISAGILLGPSLLGWAAPDLSAALFPPESLHLVAMLAEVGLVLFMFLVGLELDPRLLRDQTGSSLAISSASMAVPFALGVALAAALHGKHAPPGSRLLSFALFMGTAMSITAFPVLARILAERRLIHTRVGALALASAAIGDATAWCVLAFVVAVTRAGGLDAAILTTALTTAYVCAMLLVVHPLLARMAARIATPTEIQQNVVAAALVLVFLSSWATELIGIHALFGAFLFGAVVPKNGGMARALAQRLEDLVLIVFLPLFFVSSGLKTEIGVLDSAASWLVLGLITLVACAGKFVGSAAAARARGLGWREASAVGVLMNTRGLMELVVLSIGLDLGVITSEIFSMMVLMALFTTFITSPVIGWLLPAEGVAEPKEEAPAPMPASAYSVMLCISHRQAAEGLAVMGAALARQTGASRIEAVHLIPATGRGGTAMVSPGPGEEEGDDVLAPAIARAAELGVEIDALSFVSDDPARDICDLAVARDSDLVLLGWHKPVLSQTLLGGVVHDVMNRCQSTVGVLVNRGLGGTIGRVLVPYLGSSHDRAALGLAQRLMISQGAAVTVLHVVRHGRGEETLDPARSGARALVDSVFIEDSGQVHMKIIEHRSPAEAALAESERGYDLVIVGAEKEWGLGEPVLGIGLQPEKLMTDSPISLLVVRGPESAPRRRLARATARTS